eukprot:3853004-Pyramimonas_sp.AAC.1
MGKPLRQARGAGRLGPPGQVIEGPDDAVALLHDGVSPQQPPPHAAARRALRGRPAVHAQEGDRNKVPTISCK